MARVRMVMDVSGLRGGTADALGFPWPQHGEFLDCDQAEADALVAAGMAVPAPRTRTEPAAQDETQEPAAPAQARTAPRPKVVK